MRGRQSDLPGIEHGIPELEQLGFEYAGLRDRRMALTRQESDLKRRTLDAMRRHERMEYKVEGLTIRRVPGEETLKVVADKIKAPDDDDMEPDAA